MKDSATLVAELAEALKGTGFSVEYDEVSDEAYFANTDAADDEDSLVSYTDLPATVKGIVDRISRQQREACAFGSRYNCSLAVAEAITQNRPKTFIAYSDGRPTKAALARGKVSAPFRPAPYSMEYAERIFGC